MIISVSDVSFFDGQSVQCIGFGDLFVAVPELLYLAFYCINFMLKILYSYIF